VKGPARDGVAADHHRWRRGAHGRMSRVVEWGWHGRSGRFHERLSPANVEDVVARFQTLFA
jgi:hypothetical protein